MDSSTITEIKRYIAMMGGIRTTGLRGASGTTLIHTPYSNLIDLQVKNRLIPNSSYLITDFQTIYDQPDFDANGNPKSGETKYGSIEPLIVTAVNTNTISENAKSYIHPHDTILYTLYGTTPVHNVETKGVIIYRQDDNNNKTYYDSRAVYFKRYQNDQVFSIKDNGGEAEEWLTFDDCYNIQCDLYPFSKTANGITFNLPNNIFRNSNNIKTGYEFYNNTLFNLHNTTFQDSCYNNVIQGGANNIIQHYFYNNTIGNNFNNNTIGNECNTNTIGNDFNSNTIGIKYKSNIIGNIFNNNTIGNDFNGNEIDRDFNNNMIQNNFNGNTIGYEFNNNKIGNNFSNRIGNAIDNNTIGNNVNGNTIDTGFRYNDIPIAIHDLQSYENKDMLHNDNYCRMINDVEDIYLEYLLDGIIRYEKLLLRT